MALRINTNVAALNAHKNMIKNDNALSSSLEKLSSGLRINKAADDAAGMSIADSLRSQAMGLGQAIKNANDGINIVQTADAALEESINIVNVIKTKAIQAAQDGQTTDSRKAIQSDIEKLMEELDMIAETTSFNNQKLLFGNFTNKKFQVGAYSGETVNISISSSQSTKMGHVTSGNFSVANQAAGSVELSFYSALRDKNFLIEGVDLAYDNTAEHGLGTLAGNINRQSDVLGVSASAVVMSKTALNIAAGSTDAGFAINGVTIGSLEVQDNDSNGALIKAINQKSSQHGVSASIDNAGYMSLTSGDARAIKVDTGGSGTETILRNSDLSTFGHVVMNQFGSSDILISNVGGGDAVALTSTLETTGNSFMSHASTLTSGSTLESGSKFAAGWSTSQLILGSLFKDDIDTTSDSTIAATSTIGTGSIIGKGTTLGGTATVSALAISTKDMTLATGSTLLTGQTISGSTLGGAATITAVTSGTGVTLAAGSKLLSTTTLSGVTLGGDARIDNTSSGTGITFAAGSTLVTGQDCSRS